MKKYFKHILILILTFLMVSICILLYYSNYSIKDDTLSTQDYLINKFGLKSSSTIEKQLYLQNYKIVLLNFDDYKITYALLKKGANNRYKFILSGDINSYIDSFTYTIGKQNYFICLGYNKNNYKYMQISPDSNFKFSISNYSIKRQKYFIVYKKIDLNNHYYYFRNL